MKVIVALCFLAVASAASVATNDQTAEIVNQVQDVQFDGTYQNSFETSNGIQVQEQGVLKNAGQKDAETEEVSGSASWTAPDGTKIEMTYIANENGYQPQGSHIPVAPEIPAQIARALDWIAAHPQPEEKQYQQPKKQ